LPQYADMQIRKRQSDIALQKFYLRMKHLHISFVKQVFFCPDMQNDNFFICVFAFLYL
jgi:hypothetical protein